MKDMKLFEGKITVVARDLINRHGNTTTLDIKDQLRILWPQEMWTQEGVSKTMHKYHEEMGWGYQDNGTHRLYEPKIEVVKELKVARKKLVEWLKSNPGELVTATWIKKSGEERTAEGKTDADNFYSTAGYIILYTDEGIKSVDPRTLQKIKWGSTKLVVK